MWELIRNVGFVVGVIATLVSLWRLFRGRLKLVATASRAECVLLPTTRGQVREFLAAFHATRLKEGTRLRTERYAKQVEATGKLDETAPPETKGDCDALAEKLPPDLFADHWGYELGRALKFTDVWTIEIGNTGHIEVKDLILEFPVNGVYMTDRPESQLKEFSQRIDLGALRSRGKLKITAWSPPAYVSRDSIHLTHSGGAVPVALGEIMFGNAPRFGRWVKDNLGFVAVMLVVFFGPGVVQTWMEVHNKTAKSPSATQPASSQDRPTTTTSQ